MSPARALREHWPEYLIEAWALGCFMLMGMGACGMIGRKRTIRMQLHAGRGAHPAR